MESRYAALTRGLIAFFVGMIFLLVPSVDFLPLWNPAVTGKFIFFGWFIVPAALACVFYLLYFAVNYRVTVIDGLFLAVYSAISIRRFFFSDPGFSLRYEELTGLLALYTIVRSATDESGRSFIFRMIILGSSIQLIIGFLQLSGILASGNTYFRVTGSFFNSGPYAGYLAAVFVLSLYLIMEGSTQSQLLRYTLFFNIAGTLLMMALLKSRAGISGILAGTVFLYKGPVFSLLRKISPGKTRYFLPGFLGAILLAVVLYGLVKAKAGSSEGRLLILRNTLGMIADHPFAGVGYDRFKVEYMHYQAEYFRKAGIGSGKETLLSRGELADNVYYAFNEPLQFLAENGLAGAIAALALLGFLIKETAKDGLSRAALAGLTAVAVFSLFSYTSDILPIKMIVCILLAVIASGHRGGIGLKAAPVIGRENRLVRVAVFILWAGMVVGFFYVLFFLEKRRKQFAAWQTAYNLYSTDRIAESLEFYGSLYPHLAGSGEFLVHYGKALSVGGQYPAAIRVLTRAKRYIDNTVLETSLGNCYEAVQKPDSAEQAYLTASYMTPGFFYSRYLLFSLYLHTHQFSKARDMAERIQALPVKVPSPAVDSIKSETGRFLSRNKLSQ